MQRALVELATVLGPAIRRTLQRQDSLVRRCRLEPDDVVQRVFERLMVSPPSNPRALDPLAVLGAWSRTVALNHLLELVRRVGREDAGAEEASDAQRDAREAPQERQLEAAQRWKIACACADGELVKYKYLSEMFHAVAAEPELGARALAERIGLLAADADEETARRAEQYVWKLRERVQQKLADHFETLERIR